MSVFQEREMMEQESFTIVAAVNDEEVLEKNLLLSPGVNDDGANQLIIKRKYRTASSAYNEAISEAKNEIIIFIHQDVYLPENWLPSLKKSLSYFEKEKINWEFLLLGSRKGRTGIDRSVYNRYGITARLPEPVETLDRCAGDRKSSGL
jgi:hypothetical protein